jgi:hypothetical protein
MAEENNVETLNLHQLRALDAKVDRRFDETGKQIVEAFERVYAEPGRGKGRSSPLP